MKNIYKIFLIVILFISFSHAFAQLHGTYTINPHLPASAGNYKNFNSAVLDLVSGNRNDGGPLQGPGVSAAVVFNISDTIYNEAVTISQITGASANNTITFQSASGESSKVILDKTGGGTTLYLNGADFLVFQYITIVQDYGRAIELGNVANNNTINSCILQGTIAGDGYGEYYSVIFSRASSDSNNVFTNNIISDGSYGIYYYGTDSTYETGTLIEKNTFVNQNYSGISFYHQQAAKINANRISTNSLNTDYRGIDAAYCKGQMMLTNNKISGSQYVGLYLNHNIAIDTAPALVANNFVQTTASLSSYGIYIENSEFQNIYNNSVSVETKEAAFYLSAGAHINVENNIFVNNGQGVSYYLYFDGSEIDVSDYNDLYTRGRYVAFIDESFYTNLNDLRAAGGKNDHSVTVNPNFKTPVNLLPNSIALDNLIGNPLLVAEDIFGNGRGASHDIGASEFVSILLNSGISQPYIDSLVCAGTYNVYATLNNYGINPLTSVAINWSVNGLIQTPFNYSGALAQGASETILLGKYVYAPTIYSAINLFVWTSSPNAGVDLNHSDDTSEVMIHPGIFGTFTIGKKAGNDFYSLNKAIEFLQNNPICGSIVFNIEDGVYNDGDVTIQELAGLADNKNITFKSASDDSSKVILNGSGRPFETAVNLDGADFINFKQLTIQVAGENNVVVSFLNGANNNSFVNCVLKNIETTQKSSNYSVVYNDDFDNNNNTFKGNRFLNGSYGAYWVGNNSASGNVFDGNAFQNQSYYGVYSSNMDDFILANNNFKNKSTASPAYKAYEAYIHKGVLNVLNNKFLLHQGVSAISTGSVSSNVHVNSNNIYMDSTTALDTYLIDAEYIDSLVLNDNTLSVTQTHSNGTVIYAHEISEGAIHNNTVSVDLRGSAYGMDLGTINKTEVYSNEITINKAKTTLGININDASNSKFYDNILNVKSDSGDAYGIETYLSNKSKYYGNKINASSTYGFSYGIYNDNDSKSSFYKNTVNASSTATGNRSASGWYSTGCGGTIIEQNSFNVNSTQRAFGMCFKSGDTFIIAQNNFISTSGNLSAIGVYIYGALSSDFNNNNVNMYGSSSEYSVAMSFGYSSGFSMMNNVLSNNGGGFIISDDGAFIAHSNNNDFYTSGNSFGFWNKLSVGGLAQWRALTLLDASSISADPKFHSPSDLHVCSPALDGAGAVLSTVSIDFDGEKRNPTAPDIGADEFTPDPYALNLGSDLTFCNSIVLNAGILKNAQYLWSNNATTQSINVSSGGTYSVSVTDGVCFSENDEIIVTKSISNTATLVDLGRDSSYCVSHILDAGNPGLDYFWSNGETTQTTNAAKAGSYSVIVTDAICSVSDQIYQDIHALPVINLGENATVCGGKILDAGNPGMNYIWSTGASTQTIIADLSDTFSVVVSDAIGCKATSSVSITNRVEHVDLGTDQSVCDSIILNAGNPLANCLWSNGSTMQSIKVTSTGNYAVTVTGESGCKATDAVLVIVNKTPSLSLGPDVTVCGDSKLNAGYFQATYLWNTNETTSSITVSTSGTYSLIVSKDACSSSDEINVFVGAPLLVNLGADKVICSSSTATLDAGITGASYKWLPGGETTQSIVVSTTGNYKLALTLGNCLANDEIIIFVDPCPGLEEIKNEYDVLVYPNPSTDDFNLDFNIPRSNDIAIRVVNIAGQIVYAENLDQFSGTYSKKINWSHPVAGMYFLQIQIGSQQINRKLILKD